MIATREAIEKKEKMAMADEDIEKKGLMLHTNILSTILTRLHG